MRRIVIIFMVFFSTYVFSQSEITSQSKDYYSDEVVILENSDVSFPLTNNGILGDTRIDGIPQSVTFDGKSLIYSGGFFMSGYTDNQLWSNGVATSSRCVDYIPGNVGDSANAKIYVVNKSDAPFGTSWQEWADAVAKGADFYDGNGDGAYNPVDLNGNGIWDPDEDAPDIQGDITTWCVYNDGVASAERIYPDVEPQGIEIRQTLWTSPSDPNLKNTFFIKYSIYNTGTVAQSFDSVYFGIWADADVGNFVDDLAGCDTNLSSGYIYNLSDDSEYGGAAPVVMLTILAKGKADNLEFNDGQNMMSSFIHYMQSHPTQGDPDSKEQVRNLLLGKQTGGAVIDPCNWIYGEVFGQDCQDVDYRFMYSGEPFDSTGWVNVAPTDQRIMLNVGPFTVDASESYDIIVAYHSEKGQTNEYSLAAAKVQAQYLVGNSSVLETDDSRGKMRFVLAQNYPNPFNPVTTIKYTLPEKSHVTLNVYNTLGEKVAVLVNGVLNAGEHKAVFDASHLASGVYFYRIEAGNNFAIKKMILMK